MKPSLGYVPSVMTPEEEAFSRWIVFYNGKITFDSEEMPHGAGRVFLSFLDFQDQYKHKQGIGGEFDATFEQAGMDHAEAHFHRITGFSAGRFAAFMERLILEAKTKNIPLIEIVRSHAIRIIELEL